jgi:serine/threonine-protein kinase RsbW
MVTDASHSVTAPATPECLGAIHQLIARVADEAELPEELVARLESAAMEVVANVVEHGTPLNTVQMSVTIEASDGWFRAVVTDDGPLVQVDLDQVSMPDEMAEGGRGLAMAARLLDEFRYERRERHNVWHLGVDLAR